MKHCSFINRTLFLIMYISTKVIARAKIKPSHMTGNIVNGVPITISMYPFLAEIAIAEQHYCGGVIITSRIILTAGHCTEKPESIPPSTNFIIFLGSSYNFQGRKYIVTKTVANKEYAHAKNQYQYDLGMMVVNKQIQFGPNVQLAKIINHDRWENPKFSLVVAGYGWESALGKLGTRLKMARMHYVDRELCNKTVTDAPMPVDEKNFCMIGVGWTSDCFGDSGSGVIWRGSYVVGLVTTGRTDSCGSDVMPSMYINLYYYRDWIQKNVKQLQPRQNKKKKKNT